MRAYFVILSFIILVSGCVNPFGGDTAGGGPGVVINSLSFAPSNIKSNQLTKLSLSIENQGDYVVPDNAGIVYLFGLPGLTATATDWTIAEQSDITSNTETFGLLAPQIRGVKKYSGESRAFEWVLRAPPNLPKDEVFSYIAQARVCYSYKTKIWGRLEIVSENAWLQSPPSEHAIAVQQTQGPLKVEFISKQPLMVETDVRIKVRITNVGDGVVTANDCSIFATVVDDEAGTALNNLNKITLGDVDCTFSEELYLKKGQTKETYITCTPPNLGNNPITTSDFVMELTYNYYSDKKASISVTGTSEDASGGMAAISGGGATSVITLKDPCTNACKATGQVYTSPIGVCADTTSSTVTYPSTSVDVAIEPLGSSALNSLSTILGSAYSKATIKDLGLHDVTVGDLNLQSMTLNVLDTKANNAITEKNTRIKTTSIGIVKHLCDSVGLGLTLTLNGKTSSTLCGSTYLFGNEPLSNIITVNGASGAEFKNLPLTGLQITSIAGRTISELTGGNVTSISMEDMKVSAVNTYLQGAPVDASTRAFYLQNIKCTSSNTLSSSPSSVCQCVIGVSGVRSNPFDGVANAECNTVCMDEKKRVATWTWIDGGICNTASVFGTKQCSGTVTYDYKSRPATTACSGDTSGKTTCYCYDRVSVSTTEAALICK